MAQVNPLTRELLVKLVYYGPGLGGKTTSLQCIHQASPPETRGQIVSLATPVDRTLYFDFLPLRTTTVRGHHVRLQLFTVPGQVYFNATRKLVLTGADGVVFVADSQRSRQDANLESLENLASNLEEQGRSLAEIPLVLQYNKRDLEGVMTVEEMDESLNALGAPSIATSAATGENVLDALDALVVLVVEDLERRNALGSSIRPAAEPRFARAEDAFEEQIGRASEEIWRSTVDTALARRKGGDEKGTAPPAEPDPGPHEDQTVDRSPLPPPPAPLVGDAAAGDREEKRDTLRPSRLPDYSFPAPGQALSGPTWVRLFPGDEDDVRQIESDISEGRLSAALLRIEAVASRIMVHAGQQAGLPDVALQPALVAPLIGLEGERWLSFQRVVRRARTGGPLEERDALLAYAILIEVRARRDRLLG